jgi:protein-disulfide isomerase
MALYSKKKTFLTFKNVIFIISIISIIFIINSYYLSHTNDKFNSNNSQLDKTSIKQNNKFIHADELEKYIVNFITENPKFILDTVRNYQIEQSEIVKNESSNQNLKLINQLKLFKNDMFLGLNTSNKIIYEFVDYNCGYCQKFHNVLTELIDKDDDMRIEILQLPILSNSSSELAKIAIASSLSGDFEKVHNYLYSNKRRYDISEIFADLFLMDVNIRLIKKNMKSLKVMNILNEHKKLSDSFKLNGTPAIIIGNQIIPGYIELPKLMEILLEEFPNNA